MSIDKDIQKIIQAELDTLTRERMDEITIKAVDEAEALTDGKGTASLYEQLLFLNRFVYIQGFAEAFKRFSKEQDGADHKRTAAERS